MRPGPSLLGLPALLPALLLAGCSRGCGHDKPWTPYHVDPAASAPSAAPAPAPPPPPDDAAAAPPFTRVRAAAPPDPAATTFAIGGATFTAAAGERVALALAADLDADGDVDAAAWLAGEAGAGRLVYVERRPDGLAPPRDLAISAAAPALAACAIAPDLAQIGSRTLAVSWSATCPAGPPGAPTRWLAIASPTAEPSQRLAFGASEPAGGEKLAIDADGADHDGDGRDDLTLVVSVEGGAPPLDPAPRTAAELRWFDRPAGLSRDPEEPEASLRTVASALLARAAKAKEAPAVLAGVRGLRALATALCGAEPALAVPGGLACGASRALEDATAAEVRALLASGEVLAAWGAWERRGWLSAATTPARKAEVEKWLDKAAPAKPTTARRLAAYVRREAATSAWGSLAFEPAGTLLVRIDERMVRVDPVTGDETPADEPAWPLAVESTDGAALVGLATATNCPGAHVCLAVARRTGERALVPLPLVDLDPGRAPALDVVPVAVGPAGLDLVVAGEPIRVAPAFDRAARADVAASVAPFHPGAPRSPDGRAAAFAIGRDVLVRTPAGWQVWETPDAVVRAPAGDAASFRLRGCAAANGARAVACVVDWGTPGSHLLGWSVLVLTPGAAAAP